jgi:hypothetical protein
MGIVCSDNWAEIYQPLIFIYKTCAFHLVHKKTATLQEWQLKV